MKKIVTLALLVALVGTACQNDRSKTSKPDKTPSKTAETTHPNSHQASNKDNNTSGKYFLAFYFRYIVDTQESLAELVATKGSSWKNAESCQFDSEVLYNGIQMEAKHPSPKFPSKYTAKTKDVFPQKIDLQIKDLLHFSVNTPMLKQFSARKEGNLVFINSQSKLENNDHIIIVLSGSKGKSVSKEYKGQVKMPIKINLADSGLTPPIIISATYQKRINHHESNVEMKALLEYYTAEIEI